MRKFLVLQVSLVALILGVTATAVHAKTRSSAPFSFGYGWSPTDPMGNLDVRSWNTNETASTNTPTDQGDFSFVPAPFGPNFSASGVSFIDRVLEDRGGYSALVGPTFVLPVTGSYTGAAPSDAAEVPNFRLRVDITKLSIWGGQHPSSESVPTLKWLETTPSHEAESAAIDLQISDDFNEVQFYDQLLWNPDGYEIPLANLNDPFTRMFDLPAEEDPLLVDLRYLEGLEVEGVIRLVYDAIPGSGAPGDYNEDGSVDAADYVVWRDNPASLPNEGASLGVVDQEDYNFWRANFGNTEGSGSVVASVAAVPEPSTGLMLTLMLVLVGVNRRQGVTRSA